MNHGRHETLQFWRMRREYSILTTNLNVSNSLQPFVDVNNNKTVLGATFLFGESQITLTGYLAGTYF